LIGRATVTKFEHTLYFVLILS